MEYLLQPTVMIRASVFCGADWTADCTGLGTKAGPAEAGIPEKAVAIDRAIMANLFISLTLGQRMFEDITRRGR